MQIDVIPEWDLSAQDEAGIAPMLLRAFDESFAGRTYHQQRHHIRIVARAPQIVGHIALCYRDIRLGEALVRIIGLAEVATDPERQGQGIASALIARAIEAARASQAEFLVLFGNRPIYAGNGFRQMPNVLTYTALYGARTGQVVTARDDELMVLPLGDRVWDPDAPVDLLGFKF